MARVGTRAPAPGAKPCPRAASHGAERHGQEKPPDLSCILLPDSSEQDGRVLLSLGHAIGPGERSAGPGGASHTARPVTAHRFSLRRPPPRAERPPRSTSLLLPPSLFRPGALRGESSCSGPAGGGVRPPTPSLSEAPSRPGEHRPGRAARASAPGPAAERALAGHRPRRQPRRAASSTLLASSASQPARPATPACSSARPPTSGPIAPPTV
jgi:hypothetical protein